MTSPTTFSLAPEPEGNWVFTAVLVFVTGPTGSDFFDFAK